MVDKNALEAPCGIHCGLCPLHLAITDEALRKRLADRLNMPTDKVVCPGCRAVDGFCPVIPEQCATWLCVKKKGVEFCCECADFPCIKLAPCADKAPLRPHNIKVYSLTLRKMKGAYEWSKAIGEIYNLYYKGEMVIGHGPVLKQ
ncbi:MAG: DUF3795 domain-containing protein [Dehalococcoidia bacterium]|jgi:hypothetical protein